MFYFFFFLLIRRHPRSTLSPYTTLFRSRPTRSCPRAPGCFRSAATSPVWPSSPSARSRSEEHTSELQSPCNLVCRLLLEKKKLEKSLFVSCFLNHVMYSEVLFLSIIHRS